MCDIFYLTLIWERKVLIEVDLKAKHDCSLYKNKVIEIPVTVFFRVNTSCDFH